MKKFKLIKEYPGSPKLGTVEDALDYTAWTEFWKKISLDAESGARFITRFSKTIYTIDTITECFVEISWQVGNDTRTLRIQLETANENISNGSWTLI